jgi:hypothetical protein
MSEGEATTVDLGEVPEFTCYTIPEVPQELQLLMAFHAIEARASNAPDFVHIAYEHPHEEGTLPPESLTLIRSKFWPNGYQIRLAFKEGSAKINAQVLDFCNHWSKYANIGFIDVGLNDRPDVIVGYSLPGFWAYLGTDNRTMATTGQITMNLQGFDSGRMSIEEWFRVVEHESGHVLGCLHEQVRFVNDIDRPKAYALFEKTQGWSPQDVDVQVLSPPPAGSVGSQPDQFSVMEYALPGFIMKSGKPIIGGKGIDVIDAKTIGKIYPGRGLIHHSMRNIA